jgi:hypothetical protein
LKLLIGRMRSRVVFVARVFAFCCGIVGELRARARIAL